MNANPDLLLGVAGNVPLEAATIISSSEGDLDWAGDLATYYQFFGDLGFQWVNLTELGAAGANVVVFLRALDNALDLAAFNKAREAGLDVKVFTDALERGLTAADANGLFASYTGSVLSGHLENFVEAHDEHVACPDPAERALMRIDGDRLAS